MFKKSLLFLMAGAAMAISVLRGQSPEPIIVQPASSTQTSAKAAPPAVDPSAGLESSIASLRLIKAANEETIKKQEAMLAKLDELQQAAEQIKIFSKRG